MWWLAVDVDTERLREVCERYGVAFLEVFGSAARGEALEDELSAVFGRPVDLVGRQTVSKYIREQALADAQPLYAA